MASSMCMIVDEKGAVATDKSSGDTNSFAQPSDPVPAHARPAPIGVRVHKS